MQKDNKSTERRPVTDKLHDYIKITTPPVWIVLIAVTALLISVILWSVFAHIDVRAADGTVKSVPPVTYLIN